MKEIKSPTNTAEIAGRIFVNGPADVSNVNAIQDKLKLTPLSVFGRNTNPHNQWHQRQMLQNKSQLDLNLH